MDDALRQACAIVAQKDVQPLRRAMFGRLESNLPAARAAHATFDRLGRGRAASAFVASLALARWAAVRRPTRDGDLLVLGGYPNEQRLLGALGRLVPDVAIGELALGPPDPAAAIGAHALAEGWPVIREHVEAGDFLVAARVAETVGYYLRLRPMVARSRARAVLVSSDSNPHAVALVAAAKHAGRRTAFVTHGHVAEGPPALDVDLALLDGDAVRDVYGRAGPVRARVVLKGAEGESRPMRPLGRVRTLGVVLSILLDWPRLATIVRALRARLGPERIVVRLHPNPQMREPGAERHLRQGGVELSNGERSLAVDAARCDLVVAGSTSAHLTVLKLGVPTLYLPGLDAMGDDYYGFVRDRIVAAADDASRVQPDAIARFYAEPAWALRFARFDAGYPDRQAACDREVAGALRALVRSTA